MSTANAILVGSIVGGGLIAIGVYFGLRDAPQPAAVASSAALGQDAPPTATAPAAPTATDVSGASEQAKAEIGKALEKHRALLREKCGGANAPRASVKWTFTFDAAGKQLARGISEDRGTARPGLAACVSEHTPIISIPAPGTTVSAEVEFTLP